MSGAIVVVVNFSAAPRVATAVLGLLVAVVGLQRLWLIVAAALSLWLVLDGAAAGVVSVAAVLGGVGFCAVVVLFTIS